MTMASRKLIVSLACATFVATLQAMEIECGGDSGPERRAAAELKKYIGLLSERSPDLSFRIGVKYLDLFPQDREMLGASDGYAVRRRDGVIYVVSPQPRGCLYGVYDFLERNSDLIWSRPDEECGTIYSRRERFDVQEADFVEKPIFQSRGWWICITHRHEQTEYWNARMRCNWGCANSKYPEVVKRAVECGFRIAGSNGHNLPRHMPDKTYDMHPEYYALVNGVRRRDVGKVQFCFSNLDGAAVIGSNAVLQIAEKRRQCMPFDMWALKQADNQRLCECEACQADIRLPGGMVSRRTDENFRSNQVFAYLNRAMDVVAKSYPDLRVEVYGYQFTAPPPDIRIHPNMDVIFCPFIKNDRFSVLNGVNAIWKARAEKWAKATTNVVWREYWGCAMDFPRQHSLVAAEDLRWINGALGFTRVCSETIPDLHLPAKGTREEIDARPAWDVSGMEQWVLSRLMWNPYVPVDAYRDYYVTRTYRRAAGPMRKFFALVAKGWFSDAAMSNYCDDPYGNAARYMVRTGISNELLALLDEAVSLARDEVPATRALLDRQKKSFSHLISNAGKLEEPLVIPCVKDRSWGKAQVIESFQRVTAKRTGSSVRAKLGTRVSVMHDGKRLYVKFDCSDPEPSRIEGSARSDSGKETFPEGDHIEFVLVTDKGLNVHHFAVDVDGNQCDLRNGVMEWNARWKAVARRTDTGYAIGLNIDMESLGIELTKCNKFGACFARMAPHGGAGGSREFSSWRGVHPNSVTAFGDLFLNME